MRIVRGRASTVLVMVEIATPALAVAWVFTFGKANYFEIYALSFLRWLLECDIVYISYQYDQLLFKEKSS